MNKTKTQKGITLIALIITIVVLMVLAAVAISSIQNDGIVGHAQNATNKFTQEQQKEQDMLDYYELVLTGKAWTQNGTKVTRGEQTLNVGEEIAIVTGTNTSTPYTAKNVSEWRVLGVENGKLLLVSASSVGNLMLEGKEGYNTGIAQLTDICDDYLNTTYAEKARSIKVEDINRVTKYVSTTGETYTYTSDFEHPTKGTASASNPIAVTDTFYSYATSGSDIGETTYNALFGDYYWLASSAEYAFSGYATWGLRIVSGDSVSYNEIWYSNGNVGGNEFGARAVVSLKSDVQVVKV